MLFGDKKELSMDICYDMVNPENMYAKWKKPDT